MNHSTAYQYHRNVLTITTPTFDHDCDKCTWHGHTDDESRSYDVYTCKNDESIILRFGADGSYRSFMADYVGATDLVGLDAIALIAYNLKNAITTEVFAKRVDYAGGTVAYTKTRKSELVTYAQVVAERVRTARRVTVRKPVAAKKATRVTITGDVIWTRNKTYRGNVSTRIGLQLHDNSVVFGNVPASIRTDVKYGTVITMVVSLKGENFTRPAKAQIISN
jgi:hypothetical protein